MTNTRRDFMLSSMALAAASTAAAQGTGQAGISLANWSLNGSFRMGRWKLLDMPGILRNRLGIPALEHVNQFFENPTLNYLQQLRRNFGDNGVRSTILMVDNEGNTAAMDAAERRQSAIMHRKWIDIANYLDCISMRINVRGGMDDWSQDKDLVDRAAETIHMMLDYAEGSGLDIIVENHGGASSDPDILTALVAKVNHPKFALLCDLGNWNRGDDRYAAVRKTIGHARGLSVKGTWGERLSPDFDAEKLVRTALEEGYKGWWGIEVSPQGGGRAGGQAPSLSADERFELEIKTILEAKAIVERVVFGG